MKQIYTNITKAVLTLVIVLATSVAGFAATITVPAGTTQSYTAGMSGTIIEVYGTLNLNAAWSGGNDGNSKVTVYNGGIVNITCSALYFTSFDVKAGGVLNFSTSTFSMSDGISGILNAGTVNASNTSFTLNTNAGLQNSGTFTMKNFTVNSNGNATIANKNTGTLTINGAFTNNGTYENAATGTMAVTGSFTNNSPFTNSGTMTIGTTATINGTVSLNGPMTVAGNLTINAAVTGTNGTLTVTNGVSKMNGSGTFTGVNMRFDDKNTAGNDFDINSSNTKATNVYSKGSAQAGSVLPLRFLSFEAVANSQNAVYFKFTTTVESNLDVLHLQGSSDGKNYTTIESFTPHNMNGIFTYTSAKVETAKYTSYRIAVINLDGNKEYSKAIFYKSSAAPSTEASIYPNPVTNGTFNVKVTSAEPVIINVYSNDGKILFNTTLKGQQQYQVQMPSATSKFSLITIQVIQNGKIKSFTVLNR